MLLNILKYGASEGVAKVAPFLITLYVAKYLSPELFGKYSLFIVVFEIFFIFISFNIQGTTRVDFFKERQAQFNEIKQSHFVISFFISASLLVLFALINQFEFVVLLLIVVTSLFRTASVFTQALFQCKKMVNKYIISNLVYVITLTVMVYIFINNGGSYYSWIYAVFFASIIQFFIAIKLYGVKNFTQYLPKKLKLSSMKLAFFPALLFMPQAIGWWLKNGADRAIIAKQLGNDILGNYALAFQISSLILIAATVLNLAIVPELNRYLKDDKNKEVVKIMFLGVLFLSLTVLFMAFAGYYILNTYYSDEYTLALDIFILLLPSVLPQAAMLLLINILYYKGKGLFVAKLIFISFFTQVLINYLFIELYGVMGLVINSFIINVIVLTLVYQESKKCMKRVI